VTFGEPLVIEIVSWAQFQHLGNKHPTFPRKYAFQGGLNYSQSLDLRGRMLQPAGLGDEPIYIWLSRAFPGSTRRPTPPGRVHLDPEPGAPWKIGVSLQVPEAALATAAICLGSVWTYLEIATVDDDERGADIAAFGFSATLPRSMGGAWSPR
jgi:hypothetical protein